MILLFIGIGVVVLVVLLTRPKRHTLDDLPFDQVRELVRFERLRREALVNGDEVSIRYYDDLQLGIIGIYLNLEFLDATAALECWRGEL